MLKNKLRQKESRLPIEALRPFREGVYNLLDLLFVCLMQHATEYLLDPHSHPRVYPLLLLWWPVTPSGGRVLPVAVRSVPQNTPYGVGTLFAQYLHEAGDAFMLYFV